MQLTSDWPLPQQGIRFLVPQALVKELAIHPLTAGLYPLAMGYYPVAARHHMEREEHDNYLLIYCTAGRGRVSIGHEDFPVQNGDLILLPKGQAHHYAAHGRYPWSIYWVHFDGYLAADFSTYFNMQDRPVRHIGLHSRLVHGFESLLALRASAYQLDSFVQGCHGLQQLLSSLALQSRAQEMPSGKALNLEEIRAFMHEHLHGQLELDDLATHSQLSKFHFSKRFKALTGHAPIQYFIHLKMEQACQELDTTQKSVKQVALGLGYEDVYYFSRLFKKVIGLSPQHYRQSQHR